ncbi:lysozyme inhibitor LprI family protein [uncultured Litoreibacter sp.]|uniref:lysozyme inhibitor LprI family protein n=1 Tax=uncultured Litoreibacter sp. TaxID=1392394 RepID=UPI0034574C5E
MAYFYRLLLALLLFTLPQMSWAQPSFRCSGDLNRSEKAICRSDVVSAMDRTMAKAFRDQFRRLSQGNQRRLRAEQGAWLKWRNSCGSDEKCLQRRYTQRIADLKPRGGQQVLLQAQAVTLATPSGGNVPADVVVDRRIRNNRFEVEYGDGRVKWRNLNGSGQGTDFPDGTSTQQLPYQVEADPLPPFSGATAAWGERVEDDILRAIDLMLPEADRGPYRDLFADQPYSKRMLSHLSVIIHMVGK